VYLRNFAKLPEPAPLESVFNPVDVENGLHGNTGNRMAELASVFLDLILLHLGFRPRVYASLVCKRFTVRVCAFYRSVRVTTDQNLVVHGFLGTDPCTKYYVSKYVADMMIHPYSACAYISDTDTTHDNNNDTEDFGTSDSDCQDDSEETDIEWQPPEHTEDES